MQSVHLCPRLLYTRISATTNIKSTTLPKVTWHYHLQKTEYVHSSVVQNVMLIEMHAIFLLQWHCQTIRLNDLRESHCLAFQLQFDRQRRTISSAAID